LVFFFEGVHVIGSSRADRFPFLQLGENVHFRAPIRDLMEDIGLSAAEGILFLGTWVRSVPVSIVRVCQIGVNNCTVGKELHCRCYRLRLEGTK
jgi:hypothetical protein